MTRTAVEPGSVGIGPLADGPKHEGLCERLLKIASSNPYAADGQMTTCWHRNPDGPEAATTIRTQAAELERLREALEAQIAWRGDSPPKDGSTIYGHSWSPYRWLAYKPSSEQARRGVKGRWQTMNEFGGWENASAPNEWATQAQIEARAPSDTPPEKNGTHREG